jgi:ubiquinone/menaquinone biosynthesis C-methylase UbiE
MASEPTQLWASVEAAERWRRTAAQRQRLVGAVTDVLLNSLALQPGQRVLDLAAGTGDTTILIARRVGPNGSVLAVDISAAMLKEAASIAEGEGLRNVETLTADIVELDLPPRTFDAAVSRFGLMFLTDVVEGLRRIRAALKPSARLAASVWSSPDRNPFNYIPVEIAEQFGLAPPEGSPLRRGGALGGNGVFQKALESAGFTEVAIQAVPTPREFENVDAAVAAMQESSTLLRDVLSKLDPTQQEQALAEVRRRLSTFEGVVPGEALVGVASA